MLRNTLAVIFMTMSVFSGLCAQPLDKGLVDFTSQRLKPAHEFDRKSGTKDGSKVVVHPTFVSCGLEFPGMSDAEVSVEYREAAGAWQRVNGYHVVHYPQTGTWRTSLTDLKEDTAYEIRVRDRGGVLFEDAFSTWASEVKVAKTVEIDASSASFPIVVDAEGSPEGWIRYTVKDGAKLVNRTSNPVFVVKGARYVLLDDMTIVGGPGRTAVNISDSSYVRVRNCDISGWGRTGPVDYAKRAWRYAKGEAINFDGAITIRSKSVGTVIERCYIHDPNTTANSWYYSHPTGTEAIMVCRPAHSTVIRYCDFVGSDLKRFNDAVESDGNFKSDGGFNRDADVYGNFFIYSNDDCIELDGGQRNVRCFGNRFEASYCGLSIQGCMMSPVYVWDNLFSGMCDSFGLTGQTLKTGGGRHGKKACAFIWRNVFAGRGSGMTLRPGLDCRVTDNVFAGKQRLDGAEVSPGSVVESNRFDVVFDLASAFEHPRRPLGFELDRGRFDDVKDGFEFAARTKGTRDIPFSVVHPEAMDWFEVQPLSGTLKAGAKTVFRVTMRKDRMKDRRHYRGAFLVRTPDGLSRPVSFYSETDFVPPYRAERPGETAVYCEVPGGAELSSEPKTFVFTVPKKGRYYFLLHAKCEASRASLYAGVDGEKPLESRQQMTSYPSWVMITPGAKFGNRLRSYELEPGEHSISISAATKVGYDAVVLTDAPGSFERR